MECGAFYLFGPALYFPGNRKKAVLRFNRTLGKAGSQKCLWRRYASKCEKLHLGLGFSCLGVYRRTGFKCGQWHDAAWFGKEIGPYTQEPTLLKSISDLSSEYLNMILQKYSSVDSEQAYKEHLRVRKTHQVLCMLHSVLSLRGSEYGFHQLFTGLRRVNKTIHMLFVVKIVRSTRTIIILKGVHDDQLHLHF